MIVACLLSVLFYSTAACQKLLMVPNQENSSQLTECVTSILDEYFSNEKQLTYVNMSPDDDTVLTAIHSTMNFSLITRLSTQQMVSNNCGYLISSADVVNFTKCFGYLIQEPKWNPYAKFLIVIKTIEDFELKLIFDELLRHHVINIVVVNASDGNLYTYNPYENYACGRYYTTVTSYGLCLQTSDNLYPKKLITGLRRCKFRASLAHRPPYSLDPTKTEDPKTLLGTEEYIIRVLGETEEFTVSFNYSYDGDLFSTVENNMTAIGPMSMLQKNECDIIFGGMMMVTSRAEAFTYLCGYHDYNDELRFAVKSSSLIPTWRYIYLEFKLEVWALLFVTFVLFAIMIVILLQPKDRGQIVLQLLDNLLLHGRDVQTRFTVKCCLIMWVWFAYLINTFYQSSLFSFSTNPVMDFQVSDEEDILNYKFRPCFSQALRDYLYTETNKFNWNAHFQDEGCQTVIESMHTVSRTKDVFTLVPNYVYQYNERKYNDKWGQSLIYYFHKPYTKFLYGYFFYKGFPVTRRLRVNALRMRESGLVDKNINDHYYTRRLKQKFSEKPFIVHFLFPWCICITGLIIASVTFIIELLIKYLRPNT